MSPSHTRIVVALIALASTLPAQLTSNDNAICVWPWLAGVNINSQIASTISNAQANGFDTIYLHLYRTTGPSQGILYMADETGTWNASNGTLSNLVTLSSFIQQAHAVKIQVVGVIGCFLDTGPLPGDAAHEQLLRNVVDYLLHSYSGFGDPVYKLDGIALDRFRFYNGTNNPSAPVTNFTASMKALLGPLPLHGFLIGSPYFIDAGTYDGNFPGYAWSMNALRGQFGQDWQALAPHLDVFAPMVYVADGGVYGTNYALMQAYAAQAASYCVIACQNAGVVRRIRPAIQTYADPGGSGTTSPASIDAIVQGSLLGGAHGYNAYRYETATPFPSWFTAMASHNTPTANRPLPSVTATVQGLTVSLNASGCSDANEPATSLQVRFDTNADGTFETPFSTTKTTQYLASGLGAHRAGVEVRDSTGLTGVYVRRVSVLGSPLAVSPGTLSASGGGTCTFTIDVGPAGPGLSYVIAGSATGVSPATTIAPGVSVPLVPDSFTDLLFSAYGTPFLPGFVGFLSQTGTAQGALSVGPGVIPPSLAFFPLRFAAVALSPTTSVPLAATNAVTLTILP